MLWDNTVCRILHKLNYYKTVISGNTVIFYCDLNHSKLLFFLLICYYSQHYLLSCIEIHNEC